MSKSMKRVKNEVKKGSEIKGKSETKVIEIKEASKPFPKTEIKIESKPQPKVETKVEIKPQPKVEAKVEIKPQPKVESKVESKVELKPQQKVETKVETKPQSKVETKVEAKPQSKVETKDNSKPKDSDKSKDTKTKEQREAENKAARQAENDKEQAAKKAAKDAEKAKQNAEKAAKDAEKAKKDAELKAKKDAELKAKQEAELKAKQAAELKAKQDAELKVKQEADTKARKEAEAKAKAEQIAKDMKIAEEEGKYQAELKAQNEAEWKAKQDAIKAKQEGNQIKQPSDESHSKTQTTEQGVKITITSSSSPLKPMDELHNKPQSANDNGIKIVAFADHSSSLSIGDHIPSTSSKDNNSSGMKPISSQQESHNTTQTDHGVKVNVADDHGPILTSNSFNPLDWYLYNGTSEQKSNETDYGLNDNSSNSSNNSNENSMSSADFQTQSYSVRDVFIDWMNEQQQIDHPTQSNPSSNSYDYDSETITGTHRGEVTYGELVLNGYHHYEYAEETIYPNTGSGLIDWTGGHYYFARDVITDWISEQQQIDHPTVTNVTSYSYDYDSETITATHRGDVSYGELVSFHSYEYAEETIYGNNGSGVIDWVGTNYQVARDVIDWMSEQDQNNNPSQSNIDPHNNDSSNETGYNYDYTDQYGPYNHYDYAVETIPGYTEDHRGWATQGELVRGQSTNSGPDFGSNTDSSNDSGGIWINPTHSYSGRDESNDTSNYNTNDGGYHSYEYASETISYDPYNNNSV